MIQSTQYHSWCTGQLTEGCAQCVEGHKLVLFITGLCAQKCFYCPVSEQKYAKDVVYANEWQIKNPENPEELFKEIELTEAKGAGITGGDPLVKTERCCQYIQKLKEKYEKFHIHLYTPLKLVTEERLQKLYNAGLDEIRFHPDLDDQTNWHKLKLARKYKWKIGIEIPAIPGYEEKTKELIEYAKDYIEFINVNELERSDTKTKHYKLDEKYKTKNTISYGIQGSISIGIKIIEFAQKHQITGHLCTAKLKDAVQMKQRIKIRAKNIALPFDEQTPEGLLRRGCAYLPELVPGIGYREKITKTDPNMLTKLQNLQEKLKTIGIEETKIDEKIRIIMPQKKVREKANVIKELGLIPAIVEEYPTKDAYETEIEFL